MEGEETEAQRLRVKKNEYFWIWSEFDQCRGEDANVLICHSVICAGVFCECGSGRRPVLLIYCGINVEAFGRVHW